MAGYFTDEYQGPIDPSVTSQSSVDWSLLAYICNWNIDQGWSYLCGKKVSLLHYQDMRKRST